MYMDIIETQKYETDVEWLDCQIEPQGRPWIRLRCCVMVTSLVEVGSTTEVDHHGESLYVTCALRLHTACHPVSSLRAAAAYTL